MLDRREFLATVGSAFGVTSVSGCLGVFSAEGGGPAYPGGTVVLENAGKRSVTVSITVLEDDYDVSFETTVPGEKTHVRREFVAADAGEIVTLGARLGDGGGLIPFEYLPAGGENNTRPEVARLTIHNAVEASADWTAEPASK